LPAVEALLRGKKTPLGDEEAIGSDAQGGMMMKAAPAPALIVIEPDFLFQLLVIALNAPSAFSGHQMRERGVGWQGGQPVFGWFSFAVGPFDQEPLFRTQFGALVIPVGRWHPHAGKARAQLRVGAFAPCHHPPRRSGQGLGQLLDTDRLMIGISA